MSQQSFKNIFNDITGNKLMYKKQSQYKQPDNEGTTKHLDIIKNSRHSYI